MIMKRILPLLVLWVFCAYMCRLPAYAQRVVTLQDCLELTLGYSRDVLLAEEGKTLSQGVYIEQRSAALPQLRAEARESRSFEKSLSLSGVEPDKNEFHVNVNLTQALFTWGQIGAAIRAAGHDKAAAEHQYRQARQLAMREAATAFYDLLLTIELEKVARDNVAQRQRHLDETVRKHQMEVATDYDVLAARVELVNSQPRLTRAQNDIRLATDRVRYFMGIEEDFQVSGSLDCQPKATESFVQVLEAAKANRPEIAFFESRVGVFAELIKVAKGGNKPRLDFRGNVGWGKVDNLGGDFPGRNWDFGVFLSMPLFDGFLTKGRVIQAKSRLVTTELEMKRLLDQIALEAREAINRVDEAVQIVRGLEVSITQAERLLEMAESGYSYGVKTKLEVDDAESNLLTARLNLVQAKRDYLAARTTLVWIMGQDLQNALAFPECAMTSFLYDSSLASKSVDQLK